MESWLKHKLGVEKTLDNIIGNLTNEIKKILKTKIESKYGQDKGIITLQVGYAAKFIQDTFPNLVSLFKLYEVPHNDGGLKHAKPSIVNLLDAELEFMLYQTGAIIRCINRVLDEDVGV